MATSNYSVPLVRPATLADLAKISTDLGLKVTTEELPEYLEYVNGALSACDGMKGLPEDKLGVKYPRKGGVRPSPDDNPYNAWAQKVEIAGAPSGILSGKRIAIKDNIAVAGVPMENGSKMWQGYTPEYDATVVTRILDAGGTIAGKAVCEDQCTSGSSFTSISGPVRNPHDETRVTGGSSSGCAALLAGGVVDMAIGGDQGGSIRMPASWTGVVGMKPTHGLVPCTGALGMDAGFDHLGPMARTVTDVALLLEAIAGYDQGRDHRQRPDFTPPKYSQCLSPELTGKKFGLVKEVIDLATEEVRETIMAAIEKMRSAGAVVEEISIPEHITGQFFFPVYFASFYHHMTDLAGLPMGSDNWVSRTAVQHIRNSVKVRACDMQVTMKIIALIGEYTKRTNGYLTVAQAASLKPWLRTAYDKHLLKYNALIMPTVTFVAPEIPQGKLTVKEHMTLVANMTEHTAMFNVTGHPSISINAGFVPNDSGEKLLPVGMMLTGRHYEDADLLSSAYAIEFKLN